jgi:hypothetical protein
MSAPLKPPQLSFRMDDAIADLLDSLQSAIRGAGHAKPSQKHLVQALIHAAPRNGRRLELDVMVPYRDAYPDVDT